MLEQCSYFAEVQKSVNTNTLAAILSNITFCFCLLPHAPPTMMFLLSLISDDCVCVPVFEGEGSGKVVIPA